MNAVDSNNKISHKTIERLSLYRRLLIHEQTKQKEFIFSYELADRAHITSAQVRRDLMSLKQMGNPNRGYNIQKMIDEISSILGTENSNNMILIGVGNLGKAILSYFSNSRPDLPIVACFDVDDNLINLKNTTCPCYHISELEKVITKESAQIAILTIPPEGAQELCDQLVTLGIKSMVNFTHVPLKVKKNIFVENVDITKSLEKAVYFLQKHNHL